MDRYALDGNTAVFKLRDYLSPGGRYSYDDLPRDLEDARKAGREVHLVSVPGFLMAIGYPDKAGERPSKRPWSKLNGNQSKAVRTAHDAIRS